MPCNGKAAYTLKLQSVGCFYFGNVGSAFMPTQVQAASRKERVRAFRTHPTLAFYYVSLEQNVGWVAKPTFCEIEQFCWVLTQPTLAYYF